MPDNEEEGLVDAIAEGEEADRLFRSPVFTKALRRVEDTYTALWKSPKASAEEREMYWARIQVLGDVLLALNAVKQNGKLASKNQEANARRDGGATNRNARSGK